MKTIYLYIALMYTFAVLSLACSHTSVETLNRRRAVDLYEKAMDFYNRGMYADAIDELRAAVAFAPEDGKIHFALGLNFIQTRYFEGALESFKKAVQYRPDVEEHHYYLAYLYYTEFDDWFQASLVLRNAVSREFKFPRLHLYLGDIYFEQGRYNDVVGEYEKALNLDSTLTSANERLGLSWYYLKQYDRALTVFSKVISDDSLSVTARFSLGVILQNQGRLKEAIAQYQKVLSLEPENVDALYNLGTVYFEMGELEEALRIFQLLIVISPDRIDSYLSLAYVFDRMNMQSKAIQMYRRVLAMNPNSFDAHINLGLLFRSMERYTEALAELKRALELTNDERRKVQINEAISHLEKLVSPLP